MPRVRAELSYEVDGEDPPWCASLRGEGDLVGLTIAAANLQSATRHIAVRLRGGRSRGECVMAC